MKTEEIKNKIMDLLKDNEHYIHSDYEGSIFISSDHSEDIENITINITEELLNLEIGLNKHN